MSGVRLGRLLGQVCVLMSMVQVARAAEDANSAGCFGEEVRLHVREQFAKYGPRSAEREHFGFIYRIDGSVRSAVTHGDECRGQLECVVNPGFARRLIPAGSRVLGEWHTHPHFATSRLSAEDVRGAHANRHIRCYTAIYSAPDGTIYRWDVDATTVADAMASRTRVGNYRDTAADLLASVQDTANAAASTSGEIGSISSPRGVITAGSTASPP